MDTGKINQNNVLSRKNDPNQKGTAIVIALFVLILLSAFVALAMTRSSTEAAAMGNETAEGRTFYAAQGSLEVMTRNFNKIFETKLNPTTTDLDRVTNTLPPALDQFGFTQERPTQLATSAVVVLPGGPYAGLNAIRDTWRLRTTATDANGVQVQLTRNVLNNRIPIFQFGIFYDDDLELFRPPRFSFGGRVHSNRHFFISPGTEGVYFDSRVTTAGEIVTQTWRNGYTGDSGNNRTYIKNASGVDKQLLPDRGSVLNTTAGAANNIFASNPDMPPSRVNPNWETQSAIFDGNVKSRVDELKLPLKVGSNTDLVEMVKRGKEVANSSGGDLWRNNSGNVVPVAAADADNSILRSERFANKTGIRVSLADSKAKLPGCASGSGTTAIASQCGIRLDGNINGLDGTLLSLPQTGTNLLSVTRGYQPKPMRTTTGGSFNYIPTRVNGERLYTGGTREVWIKVETVQTNNVTGAVVTADITEDILSLGVTHQPQNIDISGYSETPPSSSLTATSAQSASSADDSRSVIKLQRFEITGPNIPGGSYLNNYTGYNTVIRYSGADAAKVLVGCTAGCTSVNTDPNTSGLERYGHLKLAKVNGGSFDKAVVPFPIEMFDTREGTYFDDAARYTSGRVTRNGVMSMIDIDVANLRRFLRGDFDGLFPTNTPFALNNGNVGLTSANIPQNGGWIFYVSDRRGDADFDGEYDMEDIYGNSPGNDGILQLGEDLNPPGTFGYGVLNTDYTNEAPRYSEDWLPSQAAVNDHKYYRRGVRLINGTTIPGRYDSATPSNTRGFTVASENAVYVQGNYNATGVASVPATGNTPYDDYQPFNTATHIPASIVTDAIVILSNNWNDAQSFSSPYNQANRVATTTQMRFALISGDTIASKEASPNQGGISPRLNGGVHNFKRFLEQWTGQRLDYSGSLINLFNSHNNNGSFKCCNTVYNPPFRNWVFDSTFLDPARIPPGTPFFQYVQVTGFQRANN